MTFVCFCVRILVFLHFVNLVTHATPTQQTVVLTNILLPFCVCVWMHVGVCAILLINVCFRAFCFSILLSCIANVVVVVHACIAWMAVLRWTHGCSPTTLSRTYTTLSPSSTSLVGLFPSKPFSWRTWWSSCTTHRRPSIATEGTVLLDVLYNTGVVLSLLALHFWNSSTFALTLWSWIEAGFVVSALLRKVVFVLVWYFLCWPCTFGIVVVFL